MTVDNSEIRKLSLRKDELRDLLLSILNHLSKSDNIFEFNSQSHPTSETAPIIHSKNGYYFDYTRNLVTHISFNEVDLSLFSHNSGELEVPLKAYERLVQFSEKMISVNDSENKKRTQKVIQQLNGFRFKLYSGFLIQKPYSIRLK
jgi:hypothetical protein